MASSSSSDDHSDLRIKIHPGAMKAVFNDRRSSSRQAKASTGQCSLNGFQHSLIEMLTSKPDPWVETVGLYNIKEDTGTATVTPMVVWIVLDQVSPEKNASNFKQETIQVGVRDVQQGTLLYVEAAARTFLVHQTGKTYKQVMSTPVLRKLYNIHEENDVQKVLSKYSSKLLLSPTTLPTPILSHIHRFYSYEAACNLDWSSSSKPREYSLDCEMAETNFGHCVYEICMVNSYGEPVLSANVHVQGRKPDWEETITDTPAAQAYASLVEIRTFIQDLLRPQDLLILHNAISDFTALKIYHPTVADTEVLLCKLFERKRVMSLFSLTLLLLNVPIQMGQHHNPLEDSQATMMLFHLVMIHGLSSLVNSEGHWSGLYRSGSRAQNSAITSESLRSGKPQIAIAPKTTKKRIRPGHTPKGVESYSYDRGFRIDKYRLQKGFIQIPEQHLQNRSSLQTFVQVQKPGIFKTMQEALDEHRASMDSLAQQQPEEEDEETGLDPSPPHKRVRSLNVRHENFEPRPLMSFLPETEASFIVDTSEKRAALSSCTLTPLCHISQHNATPGNVAEIVGKMINKMGTSKWPKFIYLHMTVDNNEDIKEVVYGIEHALPKNSICLTMMYGKQVTPHEYVYWTPTDNLCGVTCFQ